MELDQGADLKPARRGTIVLRNVSRIPFVCCDVATVPVTQVKVVRNLKTGTRGAKVQKLEIPQTIRISVNGESGPLSPDILMTSQVASAFRAKKLRGRLILGLDEHADDYTDVVGSLVDRRLLVVVGRSQPSDKKTALMGQRAAAKTKSAERLAAKSTKQPAKKPARKSRTRKES